MQAGIHIRQVNNQGLLGTVAAQDYKAGDTIIVLPRALAIELLPNKYTAAVRETHTVVMA